MPRRRLACCIAVQALHGTVVWGTAIVKVSQSLCMEMVALLIEIAVCLKERFPESVEGALVDYSIKLVALFLDNVDEIGHF